MIRPGWATTAPARRPARRTRLPAVVAVTMLSAAALVGCTEPIDEGHRWPAAAAGPACQLLEYDAVAARLGTEFDTAGGARNGATVTCALTQMGHAYPDLTLAITATSADETIFRAVLTPSGSSAIAGLGRIAYQLMIAASGTRGPGIEIAWLSTTGRVMVLRYTCAPATSPEQVSGLAKALLTLAHDVDNHAPAASTTRAA